FFAPEPGYFIPFFVKFSLLSNQAAENCRNTELKKTSCFFLIHLLEKNFALPGTVALSSAH
ncbi:hypothetical protein, partial [Bacillus cereus]